tara:strand:- start:1509 stop:8036 length:6528 start_codon:yes stop_codon:yes gene_type:complete
MPELKKTFSGGKMNKDLDDRLVPKDQYRDALNVQISTSDGDDTGVLQNLLGNAKQNVVGATIAKGQSSTYHPYYDIPTASSCVASIAAPDKDKIYYFIAGGLKEYIRKDFIVEYDVVTELLRYVFVDIHRVRTNVSDTTEALAGIYLANPPQTGIITSASSSITTVPASVNMTGVRPGMIVSGTFNGVTYTTTDTSPLRVAAVVQPSTGDYADKWQVLLEQGGVEFDGASTAGDVVTFTAPRVLWFNEDETITGINILEDFIFWTDGRTEPKKINIRRSIAGTGGEVQNEYLNAGIPGSFAFGFSSSPFHGLTPHFHTRLTDGKNVIEGLNPLSGTTYLAGIFPTPVWVNESHISVIKKGPTQPLHLDTFSTPISRVNSTGNDNLTHGTLTATLANANGFPFTVGTPISDAVFGQEIDLRVGDKIVLVSMNTTPEIVAGNISSEGDAILLVTGVPSGADVDNLFAEGFTFEVLSIKQSVNNGDVSWAVNILTIKESLFEDKFGRFSYRYKYEDGEYSTFAPWSQVAFIPAPFEYVAKKGFNLGMENKLKTLRLTHWFASRRSMPEDVVEIDLLYKNTNSPSVYTIKSFNKQDQQWPDLYSNPTTNYEGRPNRGEFILEHDNVHAVVASNQLLRPWDNVPRSAKAQAISANRVIYGNYKQNYTVSEEPVLNIGYDTKVSRGLDETTNAWPSVKSIRTYQVGVVFSDRYGRETPVITSKEATIAIPKDEAYRRNRIRASISDKYTPPSWATHFTYYIKEPSVEYYTLASDRWYDAFDGNIWLSFASSERNKVDEETFLWLKKVHGSNSHSEDKTKYKILAIENEAPDFIKTTINKIGDITNTSVMANGTQDASYFGEAGGGWPGVGLDTIEVQQAIFESNFGSAMADSAPEGISLQVVGSVDGIRQVSKSYELTSISLDETSAKYILRLRKRFGDDVAWTSTSNLFSDMIPGLEIKLSRTLVENRPEFDGRFFVKIHKESGLSEGILDSMVQEWRVEDTWQLRYINNNGYVNHGKTQSTTAMGYSAGYSQTVGNTGGLSGAVDNWNMVEWDHDRNYAEGWGFNGGTSNQLSGHPTEHDFVTEFGSDPEFAGYVWGGGIANTVAVTYGQVNQNPVKALNGGDGDNYGLISDVWSSGERAFWTEFGNQYDFFIDCCTAYSWDSRGHSGQWLWGGVENNGPFWANEQSNGLAQDYTDGAMGDGNATSQPANSRGGYANPSRGIWNTTANESLMDISWSGMYTGSQGSWNEPNWTLQGSLGPYPNKLSDINGSAVHTQAWNFIRSLVQGGTRFRFRRDPDKTVYTVSSFANENFGGYSTNEPGGQSWLYASNGAPEEVGVYGIRNYVTSGGNQSISDANQYQWQNCRQRWTIRVTPSIGSGPSEYSPIHGTNPNTGSGGDFRRALHHDGTDADTIEIVKPSWADMETFVSNPAIWETEPKDSVDVDIYYQASGLNPLYLTEETNEEYIPLNSRIDVDLEAWSIYMDGSGDLFNLLETVTVKRYVKEWTAHNKIKLTSALPVCGDGVDYFSNDNLYCNLQGFSLVNSVEGDSGQELSAIIRDYGAVKFRTASTTVSNATEIEIDGNRLWAREHLLDWSNCWSFGNGVESDRIRDDYNAAQLDNGVKASSVLAEPIKEETRKSGLIWSGIYNSISGINNTNQFIAAEKITKDINPSHGSIQALLNRDTRLILFCEDKILRAETNKDALYNADGNPQLIASNAVVGDVTAYQGDYGVSTNPESIAVTPSTTYFTDAMRGKALAIYENGIKPISDFGMKDWFSKACGTSNNTTWTATGWLKGMKVKKILGSYDARKNEYNLTFSKSYNNDSTDELSRTVSYSDIAKGWVSFKSFIPEQGVSINNNYYTFSKGQLWKHHDASSSLAVGWFDPGEESYHMDPDTIAVPDNYFSYGSLGGYKQNSGPSVEGKVVSGIGIPDGTTVVSASPYNGPSGSNGQLLLTLSENIYPELIPSELENQYLRFEVPRNNFYGEQYFTGITTLFNDNPGVVKNFKTLNYEGSHANKDVWDNVRVEEYNNDITNNSGLNTEMLVTPNSYDTLFKIEGWECGKAPYSFSSEDSHGGFGLETNLQKGRVYYFKSKEGKWFGDIQGGEKIQTRAGDESLLVEGNEKHDLGVDEFSTQGLGTAVITHSDPDKVFYKITVASNESTTYTGNQGFINPWDPIAD